MLGNDELFIVGDYATDHQVGDANCGACWSPPGPCNDCDGGLVHSSWGDYSSDDSYWLYYKCDGCGSTEKPL